MITIITKQAQVLNSNRELHNSEIHEIRCLSADTKPTDVSNGSSLIEMDTGKVYLFDQENSEWTEV